MHGKQKGGHLVVFRQMPNRKPKAGKSYWMAFSNSGRVLSRECGDREFPGRGPHTGITLTTVRFVPGRRRGGRSSQREA